MDYHEFITSKTANLITLDFLSYKSELVTTRKKRKKQTKRPHAGKDQREWDTKDGEIAPCCKQTRLPPPPPPFSKKKKKVLIVTLGALGRK